MSSQQLRLRSTAYHMVIALAVLVIPLVLLVAMCRPEGSAAPSVDADRTYRAAATQAKFTVLRPTSVPNGYRASQAAVRPAEGGALSVRLTYVHGDSAFQFLQTNAPADSTLQKGLDGANMIGIETIGGRDWQRYNLSREGETAFVHLAADFTAYVAGDASPHELRAFIAQLAAPTTN